MVKGLDPGSTPRQARDGIQDDKREGLTFYCHPELVLESSSLKRKA